MYINNNQNIQLLSHQIHCIESHFTIYYSVNNTLKMELMKSQPLNSE